MDDSLEKPNALLDQNSNREADDEGSSGDEYDGPDWTKLSLYVSNFNPLLHCRKQFP